MDLKSIMMLRIYFKTSGFMFLYITSYNFFIIKEKFFDKRIFLREKLLRFNRAGLIL